MLAAGFEPAIPASERPQTHALDRGAHQMYLYLYKLIKSLVVTIRTPRLNAKYSAIFPHFVLHNLYSRRKLFPDIAFTQGRIKIFGAPRQ